MGTSTNGILLYGFSLEEEDSKPWNIMDSSGEPYEDYEEALDTVLGTTDKEWKERSEAREALGVDLELHCSYDYSMYMVAIKETVVTAYRGSPVKVATRPPEEDWDKKLRVFCKLLKINIKGLKPAWWLCSLWG